MNDDVKYMPLRNKQESIDLFVEFVTKAVTNDNVVIMISVKGGHCEIRANVPPDKQLAVIDHALHVMKGSA